MECRASRGRRASQLCGVWRTPAGSPPKQPPSADTPCNAQYTGTQSTEYTMLAMQSVYSAHSALGTQRTQCPRHARSTQCIQCCIQCAPPPCVLSLGAGIQLTKCCGAKYTAGKAFVRASWNRSDKAATTKLITQQHNQMTRITQGHHMRKRIAGRTHQIMSHGPNSYLQLQTITKVWQQGGFEHTQKTLSKSTRSGNLRKI